ncbi:hypothetical protein SAMN05661093_08516 [Kibdelosporangium aridum]|uniref:Uncharacterized protein n=1 Tax=Kibdelosporangium aridum TaxID=2030 RepID=A0A1W2FR51_KIBAR|nr:hypothetical protein SAMN05661093_08516 [Kibdelosporangium aridum]
MALRLRQEFTQEAADNQFRPGPGPACLTSPNRFPLPHKEHPPPLPGAPLRPVYRWGVINRDCVVGDVDNSAPVDNSAMWIFAHLPGRWVSLRSAVALLSFCPFIV